MGREIIDEEQKLLEEIGKKLKILRKKTKKTLKQVSDEIHITAADISKYERGKRGDIGGEGKRGILETGGEKEHLY